ncbi:hypothetical protein AHAS_Ahas17G0083600 [Arachis hypogaea]
MPLLTIKLHYCKPYYEHLFKETGTFKQNFQSRMFLISKIETRSPSKAAGMLSGTQEKCATCAKIACPITTSNDAALEVVLYCKHHFSQLFKEREL